jgi:hypothetical protein
MFLAYLIVYLYKLLKLFVARFTKCVGEFFCNQTWYLLYLYKQNLEQNVEKEKTTKHFEVVFFLVFVAYHILQLYRATLAKKRVTQDVETMKMKEQKLEPIALDKNYISFWFALY